MNRRKIARWMAWLSALGVAGWMVNPESGAGALAVLAAMWLPYIFYVGIDLRDGRLRDSGTGE